MSTNVDHKEPPQRGLSSNSNRLLVLISVAVFANAAATAWGFSRLKYLSETVRWVTAARIASATAGIPAFQTLDTGVVSVELFSDFSCEYCQNSASAVIAARKQFGDAVTWRYRFVTRSPMSDPVSFQAALIGVCTVVDGGPWSLYEILTSSDLNRENVEYAVSRLDVDRADLDACMRADSTEIALWTDMLVAAARGVNRTPTVFVDGSRLEGEVSLTSLVQMIETNIDKRSRTRE